MDDRTMITVLVTGVGAIIGYGIVKALRMAGLETRIIGADMDPRAVGFGFCDGQAVVPAAGSKDYCPALIELCRKEGVAIVFPGIEQEVAVLMQAREAVEREAGVRVVLNAPEVYAVSRDKWRTFEYLRRNGFPAPETCLVSDSDEPLDRLKFPFLLKPRFGQSGKGIVRIETAGDFRYWRSRVHRYIAQQLIGSDDQEYTTGVFGMGREGFVGPIVMRRRLRYGATFEAEADDFPEVRGVVTRLCERLHPVGPTNVQLRLDGTAPSILEINPRLSASASLKAAFGFNEAEMAIRYFLYGQREFPVAVKKGYARRYIEDRTFLE